MTRKVLLLALLALMFALNASSERRQLIVDVAADDTLNVRTAPNASASIIAELPPGVIVQSTGLAEGNWIEVEYSGGRGWINSRYAYAPPPDKSPDSSTPVAATDPNEKPRSELGTDPRLAKDAKTDLTPRTLNSQPPENIGELLGALLASLVLLGLIGSAWRTSFQSTGGKQGWRISDKISFVEPFVPGQLSEGDKVELALKAQSQFKKLRDGEIQCISPMSIYFVEFYCECEGHYRGNVTFVTYGVGERKKQTRQYVDLFERGFASARFAEGIPKEFLPKLRRHMKSLSHTDNCLPARKSENPKAARRMASVLSDLERKAVGDMKTRATNEMDRAAEERGRQSIGDVISGEPLAMRASGASRFGMKFDGIKVSRSVEAWELPGYVFTRTIKARSGYFLCFPSANVLIPLPRNALKAR